MLTTRTKSGTIRNIIIQNTELKPEELLTIRTEKRSNFYAAWCFVVFMFIIGVPLWWFTTLIYWVSLPSESIENLNKAILQYPVAIKLIISESSQKSFVDQASEKLSKRLSNLNVQNRIRFKFDVVVEEISQKYVEYLNNSQTVDELDEKIGSATFFSASNNFVLTFFVLPKTFMDEEHFAYFGSSSIFYVKQSEEVDKLTSIIEESLTKSFLKLDKLHEVVGKNQKRNDDDVIKRKAIMLTNFESKLTFEISFVVPDPTNCRPNVDAEKIFDKHFQPFVDTMKPLTDVKFKSQVLYYIDFDAKPNKNEAGDGFFYDSNQLPHLVNSLETYTGGFDAEESVYRIILYLTPPSKRPLFIYEENRQEMSPDSSFIVSSWGGVILVNDETICTNGTSLDNDVQNIIMSQVRHLLGFNFRSPAGSTTSFNKTSTPLAVWEIQSLLYVATTDYFLDAVSSINSLVKLIDRIDKIQITDRTVEQVDSAVKSAADVLASLESKKDLVETFRYAKNARAHAGRAFFDPSLLLFLYFPQDVDFKIYIGLLVAPGFIIVCSIKILITYFQEDDSDHVEVMRPNFKK